VPLFRSKEIPVKTMPERRKESMPWPFRRKSTADAVSTKSEPRPEMLSKPASEVVPAPDHAGSQIQTTVPAYFAARFSFRLFAEVARTDASPNLFLSPASVAMCLGMAREIASGKTRQEIGNVLGLDELAPQDADDVFASLNRVFRQRVDVTLSAANSLWRSNHTTVLPQTAARLRDIFDAEITALDFSSPAAPPQINSWVSEKTCGKIASIVGPLSPLTALIGVNAIYFKGLWQIPFRPAQTYEGTFTTSTGASKRLPMMRQAQTFSYYEDAKLQAIALPYGTGSFGDKLAMYVLLPASGTDLRRFVLDVNSDLWHFWLARFERIRGTIELPKFKFDYGCRLRSPLSALGMKRAFDSEQAQFDGVRAALGKVWLDEILHKTMVDVNEAGTEAAAVTAMTFTMMKAMPRPQRTFHMVVDRPFVVAVRDLSSSTILFLGCIGDPES
jgi:serine protease inhibitor